MSKFIALIVFVASPALAKAEPLQRARALETTLDTLKTVALDSADNAAMNQNKNAEAKRDAVATQAVGLALDLHQEVQRAIKLGFSKNQVRNRLENLEPDLIDLSSQVNQNGVAQPVRNAFEAVENAWFALASELQGQGPPQPPPPMGGGKFTADCVGKFGGNFFKKQTHVECTVKGKGAVAYSVQFQNQVGGGVLKASADGALNPSLNQQTFTSNKVSVGNFAHFWVWVRANGGKWQLADQGQAQGNPF
jgi:hypothetical protein